MNSYSLGGRQLGECTAGSSGGDHGLFSRVRPQTHTCSPHTPPALRGSRARLSQARRGGELKTPADAPAAPIGGPAPQSLLACACRWYENITAVCYLAQYAPTPAAIPPSADKRRVALAAAARAAGALAAAPPPLDRRRRMGAPSPQQRTGAPQLPNHNLHHNFDRLLCYLSFRQTSVQRCHHLLTRHLTVRDERWRNAAQRPSSLVSA